MTDVVCPACGYATVVFEEDDGWKECPECSDGYLYLPEQAEAIRHDRSHRSDELLPREDLGDFYAAIREADRTVVTSVHMDWVSGDMDPDATMTIELGLSGVDWTTVDRMSSGQHLPGVDVSGGDGGTGISTTSTAGGGGGFHGTTTSWSPSADDLVEEKEDESGVVDAVRDEYDRDPLGFVLLVFSVVFFLLNVVWYVLGP